MLMQPGEPAIPWRKGWPFGVVAFVVVPLFMAASHYSKDIETTQERYRRIAKERMVRSVPFSCA